jgi:hypothetical protein
MDTGKPLPVASPRQHTDGQSLIAMAESDTPQAVLA